MKRFLIFFGLFLSFVQFNAHAVDIPFDPYFWLEEVESESSITWVKHHNDKTIKELESHPEFNGLFEDMKSIYLAKDRFTSASFENGYFYELFQNDGHKQGLLRRTTFEEYRKDAPVWETILDFDELSRKEGKTWVYKGSVQLGEKSSRRLLELSPGGGDASVYREFDYDTKQFITDGFNLPKAKSRVTAIDENQIIVGTDFGPDSLTKSGYPRILKLWKRGQPLSEAKTVFEVNADDISASSWVTEDGNKRYITFFRIIDRQKSEKFLQNEDGSLRHLKSPPMAAMLGLKNGQLYWKLKKQLFLNDRILPDNAIIRYPIEDESGLEKSQILFVANSKQSIKSVSIGDDTITINLIENVRSKVIKIRFNKTRILNSWTLPFPDTGVIEYSEKYEKDPTSFTSIVYYDHLTPKREYIVHDEDGSYRLELLRSAPSRFDSSSFEVVQNFSTSRDGTKIPYFLLKQKNLVLDGKNPTLLYGYGGFENSQTPTYSGPIGKAWLERGGVYVVANIRGGGEYGPSWHQAALKEKRQTAYDDFISVAEDLIAQKITSPAHLGIQGGSNGGLLVGATMVQRPDLFNAALIQVPLLDMVRYSKLHAGASWIGEYGDPDDPKMCEYLLTYSPFHNVKPGKEYPHPMFTTSTKDDRVHPAHARKMAARMKEQGHRFHYFENLNGGHAGSANPEEAAYVRALEFTYLWSRLK